MFEFDTFILQDDGDESFHVRRFLHCNFVTENVRLLHWPLDVDLLSYMAISFCQEWVRGLSHLVKPPAVIYDYVSGSVCNA